MTPYLEIDAARLAQNIAGMQALADANGLRLRPHVKTHKSFEIARRQMAAGAEGITASQPYEALAFLRAGFGSVTMAFPVVDDRVLESVMAEAASRDADLRLVIDSIVGVESAERAASAAGRPASAYLEIDVGLGRCGVQPDDPDLMELASRTSASRWLRFAGLLSHAGQAYGASSADEVRAIARIEQQTMLEARGRIEAAGIDVPIVSVGSTPTVLAAHSFDGIDEIRPGNYVFLDRTQVSLGVTTYERIALTVCATIVSRNSEHYIVDAGSKTLSSDRGAQGSDRLRGYGLALPEDVLVDSGGAASAGALIVERLSEEHGFIARGESDLPIGTRLRIVPNHACVVANLAAHYHVVGLPEPWSVDAHRP